MHRQRRLECGIRHLISIVGDANLLAGYEVEIVVREATGQRPGLEFDEQRCCIRLESDNSVLDFDAESRLREVEMLERLEEGEIRAGSTGASVSSLERMNTYVGSASPNAESGTVATARLS